MPRKYTGFKEGFLQKVSKIGGCWIWNGAMRGGRNNQYGNYRGMMAHRVSWEIHNGKKIPSGMMACHKCDTPLCVNPDHIFIGMGSDNAIDMFRKRRSPLSDIDLDIAKEIRGLNRLGVRQSEIADWYGISRPSVCNIVKFKRWPEVSING